MVSTRCLISGISLLIPLFAPAVALNPRQNPTQPAQEPSGISPCDTLISVGLGERLLFATSDEYEPRIQSWWSANGRFHPWCLVQPHDTEKVSIAVKTLAGCDKGAGNWHIAVRSGGHGYPGTNNIDNGVTIDLGKMNGSSYDPERKVASVQPGGQWASVYANLLNIYSITVTGGCDGSVGVGGFLLGGGNSFYSGRNGFGCDTVLNYEVVLANGSIVNTNSKENSDLWKSLKGGSLNFGIVTRFDFEAMPAVDLAYARNVISGNQSDEVIDSIVQLTNNSEELGVDALVALYTHNPEYEEDIKIMLVRANTMGNLHTTTFDRINAIPSHLNTWEHKSLAKAADESRVPAGMKNIDMAQVFHDDPETLRQSADAHKDLVATLTSKIGAENFLTQWFFQPFPSYFAEIGKRKGGNVLGQDRIGANAILCVPSISILNGDDAALAFARAQLSAAVTKMKQYTIEHGTDADLQYLNYADLSQNPLVSYGSENVALLKSVAKKYDPEGFWQYRVPGGFKISRVSS